MYNNSKTITQLLKSSHTKYNKSIDVITQHNYDTL